MSMGGVYDPHYATTNDTRERGGNKTATWSGIGIGASLAQTSARVTASEERLALEKKNKTNSSMSNPIFMLNYAFVLPAIQNPSTVNQPSSHQPQSAPHPDPHSSQRSLWVHAPATKAPASCCKTAIAAQ